MQVSWIFIFFQTKYDIRKEREQKKYIPKDEYNNLETFDIFLWDSKILSSISSFGATEKP